MKGSVRQVKQVIADVGVGLISGYVGTKVMEPVSMKLYELEPEAERKPGRLGAARSSLRASPLGRRPPSSGSSSPRSRWSRQGWFFTMDWA